MIFSKCKYFERKKRHISPSLTFIARRILAFNTGGLKQLLWFVVLYNISSAKKTMYYVIGIHYVTCLSSKMRVLLIARISVFATQYNENARRRVRMGSTSAFIVYENTEHRVVNVKMCGNQRGSGGV